jgi:hypothetical protein
MSGVTLPSPLNAQLRKAIHELEKMGVRVHVEGMGDIGFVFIDVKSIGEAVINRVRMGCKQVFIEGNYLIIKVSVRCQESTAQRT